MRTIRAGLCPGQLRELAGGRGLRLLVATLAALQLLLFLHAAIAQPPPGRAVNYRSIGTHIGPIVETGTASVAAGSSVVTFSDVSLPSNLGQGDRLILDSLWMDDDTAGGSDDDSDSDSDDDSDGDSDDDSDSDSDGDSDGDSDDDSDGDSNGEALFILSRDGNTQVTVQSPSLVGHDAVSFTISRAYNTIQEWEDTRDGNLVAENRVEVAVLYDDGPFTRPGENRIAKIEGSVTDPDRFMVLIAAEGHQHSGVAGAGVILDGEGTTKHGLRINDDYTWINGLQFRSFRGENGASALEVKEAIGVVIENVLVHDFRDPEFSVVGIKGSDESNFTVRNCIVYDGDTAGIRLNQDDAQALIQNCTIFDIEAYGIYEDDGEVTVENTISVGNNILNASRRRDIYIERGTQSYNISSDGSAAGMGSLTGVSPEALFVSVTPLFEDLHLLEDAPAVDAGKDLSVQFAHDIDLDMRPMGESWDMGADELYIEEGYLLAQANPDTGPAPLSVIFSATIEGDFVLYEWDFDGDGIFDYSSLTSPDTVYTYQDVGTSQAVLRGITTRGSEVTSTVTITVTEGLTASITAYPTSGTRPLNVRFSPEAQSTGAPVGGYRWDFNGDGIWDTGFDRRPSIRTYTYHQAGVFNAKLQVRDEEGRTADAVQAITVLNPQPTVQVGVIPSNGPAPLEVTFAISASSPNGAITSVVLDPGDGSLPISTPGPGNVPHTYNSQGSFSASVTVTDSAGESTTISDLRLDVRVGPAGSPTAVGVATPSSGAAPLTVTFTSDGSSDAGSTLVRYEWDFDFDGTTFVPDFSSITPQPTSYTYDVSGTHFAALRVTDDFGLTGVDVVPVLVELSVTVAVPDDTINPYNSETVPVRTTLSAGVDVTVYLRDRGGARVRTLFSGSRSAGTYDDQWDGLDDTAQILLDGDYYAEAEYQLEGQTFVEPDTPSGGQHKFVSYSQNIQNGGTWDPWEDQFWELVFDTVARGAGASEISLWITPYYYGSEIAATLLGGEVFGSGRYKYWWDAVKDNGQYVEPRGQRKGRGNDYLWSAQAFMLPNNTIVVEGGRPIITTPSADPNLFDATTHRWLTGKGNEITLTISRESTVEIRIYNMDNGNLLRILTFGPLPAGTNTVEWDGKAITGEFVAPGPYRAEITAMAADGNASLLRRVLIFATY